MGKSMQGSLRKIMGKNNIPAMRGGYPVMKEAQDFQFDIQTAIAGQTVFTTSFPINVVFKNSVVQVTSYTGKGSNSITFNAGLLVGDEVYLTT